ncbi:MAG: laminin G domain-containing protein [Lentisphaerae bacterium]|nr:laminin G domain-containing protein [Lentisphaerota bacterium]
MNSICRLRGIAVVILISMALPGVHADLIDGLDAYWEFGETNGVFVDTTGNGNTLLAQNGPYGDGANGILGGGLHCDLFGPYDRAYATNAVGKYNLTSDSFTLTLWFRPTATPDDFQFYAGWSHHEDNLRWSLCNDLVRTNMRFRLQGKGAVLHELVTTSGPLDVPQGDWVFMALTYDAGAYAETTNVTVTLYADAQVVAQDNLYLDPDATWGPTNPAVPFSVGARHFDAAGGVNGDIDEVGLWHRVLTADELEQLFNAGFANPSIAFAYAEESLLDGLDAYWACEETNGSIIDSSDNGHDLSAFDDPYGNGSNGLLGGGLDCDPAGTDDFAYGTDNVGKYNLTNDSFTVALWYRPEAVPTAFQVFAGWIDNTPGGRWSFCNGVTDREAIRFRLQCVGGGIVDFETTATPLDTAGEWVFLTATYDASAYADTTNVTVSLYADGRLLASGTTYLNPAQTWAPSDTNIPFSLAGRYDTASAAVDGDIDEVGLWNRVLTFEEIGRLYNGGYGYRAFIFEGPENLTAAGLDAYWPLDEAWRYEDATGNGNDLLPLGSPGFAAGKIRQALDLDGASRLYAGNTVGQYYISGTWTVTAWVKQDRIPFDYTDFKWYLGWESGPGSGQGLGWSLRDAGNNWSRDDLRFIWLGTGDLLTRRNFVLGTTNWLFLANTLDGRGYRGIFSVDTVLCKTYVNGAQVDAREIIIYENENNNRPTDGTPFSIGARGNDGAGAIDGRFDEVGLWSRVLSAQEIWQLYNNGEGYREFIVSNRGSLIMLR